MEGPWLVDQLWEAHVTFFLLHNKLLQVAIWLGPWTISILRILTTWQTSVCWSMIYLCEAVAQGVRSFGSTMCTRSFPSAVTSSVLQLWSLSHESVSFATWSALSSSYEQRKFESTTLPPPLLNSFPPPPFSGSILRLPHIFRLSPLRFWLGKHQFLDQRQVSLCRWQHMYSRG